MQKAYILVSNDPSEIQRLSAYTAKTLSSIIKTCLGPRAMQKMVLTKINSIELTNDGNTILREMDVSHPSARCLIELSQTQDDECGDGTTSVLILAAELLGKAVTLLDRSHPIRLCNILFKARSLCLDHLSRISIDAREEELLEIVSSSVSTKLCSVLKVPIPQLALEAVQAIKSRDGRCKIDIKNDIKIDKILGSFEESEIVDGILIEKDLIHSQMRRVIENPKILVLDSPLEYKKGESVTNMEFSNKNDFTRALQIEEEQIRRMCTKIIETKADVVVTEKGVCDLALSILYENNITAVRRIKKSDSTRISRATGAIVMNRIEDVSSRHLGTAGLFEYVKIGRDYYCKLSRCQNPRAVSVVLRGPTKDLLAELERNFMDAAKVAKNVLINPKLVPGGGASEMSMSMMLSEASADYSCPVERNVFEQTAEALKVIPSVLANNSGAGNSLEILNELEKRQARDPYFGVDGISGKIVDMRGVVMEPLIVKTQCVKSAFESVMQLLRIDGIIESKSK